jgi:hypothetical protein
MRRHPWHPISYIRYNNLAHHTSCNQFKRSVRQYKYSALALHLNHRLQKCNQHIRAQGWKIVNVIKLMTKLVCTTGLCEHIAHKNVPCSSQIDVRTTLHKVRYCKLKFSVFARCKKVDESGITFLQHEHPQLCALRVWQRCGDLSRYPKRWGDKLLSCGWRLTVL